MVHTVAVKGKLYFRHVRKRRVYCQTWWWQCHVVGMKETLMLPNTLLVWKNSGHTGTASDPTGNGGKGNKSNKIFIYMCKAGQVLTEKTLPPVYRRLLFSLYFTISVLLCFDREHANGVRVGLHNNNLLLRSCTIRNTETVVGIVVYAGEDTALHDELEALCVNTIRTNKHLFSILVWIISTSTTWPVNTRVRFLRVFSFAVVWLRSWD